MPKFFKKVPLAGSERKPLPGATDQGPVSPDENVSVSIYVRSKGQLPDLSATASGAAPRPPMSQSQVMDQFAAAPEDIALVEEFARAHNLKIVESSPEKRSVKVTGTAADMAKAFDVQLHRYARANGKNFRGRKGEINIPTELAGVVEGVFGLDNRKMARSYRARVQRGVARADGAAPLPAGSFLPTELGDLYHFPANTDGSGQVIGILTFNDRLGGYSQPAIETYFKNVLKMKAAPHITNVVVAGPGNVPSTSEDPDNVTGEVMLDAQVIGALVPAAKIVMYFTEFTEQGWVDVIHTVVADAANNPSVLSISYGNPEDAADGAWTRAAITQVNKAFSAAAAKGITIFCASGDDGSRDQASDNKVHADYPASDPFVLGVGGTTVKASNGRITSEVVWNDREGAGGGGISTIFGVPDFQKDIAFLKKPPSHKPGRGVPDVAANADPETGYAIIDVDGQNLDITGGTSASAPLWAALICRLNQALGTRLGYINPLLYTTLSTGVLNDITQGNIGAFRTATGWDPASGIGSPDGERLLAALKPGAKITAAT
jgi:kumamolisin